MARLRTLHKRRRRAFKIRYEMLKAYLYLIAIEEIVSQHTWKIDKVEDTNIAKLYYVNDDWPQGLCRVRIRTTYKDSRGTFYCIFPLSTQMIDDAPTPSSWQRVVLERVPHLLASFLIKHPTKVKELRPIAKAFYAKRR